MTTSLGMEMDFGTDPGTMIISMIKYLHKIMKNVQKNSRGQRRRPQGITCLRSEKKRIESCCLKNRLVSYIEQWHSFCSFAVVGRCVIWGALG